MFDESGSLSIRASSSVVNFSFFSPPQVKLSSPSLPHVRKSPSNTYGHTEITSQTVMKPQYTQ